MKRISKKVREEAALICSVMASQGGGRWTNYAGVQTDLDLDDNAWRVACLASIEIEARYRAIGDLSGFDIKGAEAESLLRTGWSPS